MQRLATCGGGRFQVLSELGKGGMGVVFEALDRDSGLRVAIKTIGAWGSASSILQFKREFRALRDIQHPNLVRLGELFEERGQWFFTMERIRGTDFLNYVRHGTKTLDVSKVLSVDPARGPRPDTKSESRDSAARIETSRLCCLKTASGTDHCSSAVTRKAPKQSPDAYLTESFVSSPDLSLLGEGGLPFSESRLRQALRELAAGLAVLHRAGKVHRDIKPSNILVEESGRVVLLDFGVVADLRPSMVDADDARDVVGTIRYMAPEQAVGAAIGPETDWYAVGMLLFQALTGQLPFSGHAAALRYAKCYLDAPSPRQWNSELPEDLVSLCERLLARNPGDRPGDHEILRILGVDQEEGTLPTRDSWDDRLFVGRSSELSALWEAYEQSRQGHAVAVFLGGQSGVGKTETALHFLEHLEYRVPSLVVLRGRCHEKEPVPYNAFDGVVDDLTRFLEHRSPKSARRYLPDVSRELLQVFPVMAAIGGLRDEAVGGDVPLGDETVIRTHAFAALGSMLVNLATHRPLVVFIDDVHWADRDSLALLRVALRMPQGTRLLVVATYRGENVQGVPSILEDAGYEVHRQVLGPLAPDESRKLVTRLCRRLGTRPSFDVDLMVRDTAGHPMFLDEMVRHAAHRADGSKSTIRLDDALWSRANELSEATRAVLQVVVAADTPLRHRVVSKAVGARPEDYVEHTMQLRVAKLVRVSGTRQEDTIEAYHDRIRQAVYHRLSPQTRAMLHARLASLLEADGEPPETLALHFIRGGIAEKGAEYALAAARRVARTLAFAQAARLYQLALDHGRYDMVERRGILREQGECLAHAGRTREAGQVFLEASSCGNPSSRESIEFQRRAAEQLLIGGHFREGLRVTRGVLATVGLPLPGTPLSAMAATLACRAYLAVRGLGWEPRRECDISPDELQKLDVCMSTAMGLSMLDPIRGGMYSSLSPCLSLHQGEPYRISRALCAMSFSESGFGKGDRAQKLLAATRKAAALDGSDLSRFNEVLSSVAHAFMIENDWAKCVRLSKDAMVFWRKAGRGRGWEVDVLEQFVCWSLWLLGDVAELDRRVKDKILMAQAIGNHYAEVAFRTCFACCHFIKDDPRGAVRDANEAISGWLPESQAFGTPHFWALKIRVQAMLYTGDPKADAGAISGELRRLDRALLSQMGIIRVESCQLRAQVALARATQAKHDGNLVHKRIWLGAVRYWIQRLRQLNFPIVRVILMQLEAGMANVEDRRERAIELLRELVQELSVRRMALAGAAAKRRLGECLGGQQGARLVEESQQVFDRAKVVDAGRMTDMTLPGWHR